MRLLHIIASMNPVSGGPCQGIRNLNSALGELNVHREVVCLDDPATPFVGSDSFIVHALGPSKTSWQYSEKLLPWLTENLSRFDVVLVNGLWLYHVYAAMKVLRTIETKNDTSSQAARAEVPKIFIMPHGMLDPYFQNASDRKWKSLRNTLYWKFVERGNINRANGLFFTCQVELELARTTFSGYKPKREINIGYGVEAAPVFTPAMSDAFGQACPDLNQHRYLLFLSRIHSKKGVDLLLRAYAQLTTATNSEPGSSPCPKLVIAGPGMDSPYGQMLQNIIQEHPQIRSSVLFPGMLKGDAKWGALYGCYAFVLPSHQENFGIAVVEALSCGKPVLISNQVNIWKEIIKDGGGIANSDDLPGTLQTLQGFLQMTDEQKTTMGTRALQSYENHFSIVPAANRFLKALQSG